MSSGGMEDPRVAAIVADVLKDPKVRKVLISRGVSLADIAAGRVSLDVETKQAMDTLRDRLPALRAAVIEGEARKRAAEKFAIRSAGGGKPSRSQQAAGRLSKSTSKQRARNSVAKASRRRNR